MKTKRWRGNKFDRKLVTLFKMAVNSVVNHEESCNSSLVSSRISKRSQKIWRCMKCRNCKNVRYPQRKPQRTWALLFRLFMEIRETLEWVTSPTTTFQNSIKSIRINFSCANLLYSRSSENQGRKLKFAVVISRRKISLSKVNFALIYQVPKQPKCNVDQLLNLIGSSSNIIECNNTCSLRE